MRQCRPGNLWGQVQNVMEVRAQTKNQAGNRANIKLCIPKNSKNQSVRSTDI